MKLLIIALLSTTILAQDFFAQSPYHVDSIPIHLRTGAIAVIRSNQIKVTVINEEKSHLEVKQVITLLNENAEDLLNVNIPYNDLRKVNSVSACAYNKEGKLIWTLQKMNIVDMRDFSGPEMLSNDRKKAFLIPSYNYPFTIEYSYKMTLNDIFLSSTFFLNNDPEVSVEESGLQYIIPVNVGFNYKAVNLNTPTDSFLMKDRLYLSWKEDNLPTGRQRLFAPALEEKLPVIYATPVNVDLDGYKGRFDTWQSYGSWMSELIKDRDVLDRVYADEAMALVKNIPERREKIKVLYEYMQKHTRYFSISFGIGGKQPIHANEVAKNGYGDCKALSNYMKALLKAVGIESYYTLVKAGEGVKIQSNFPCNQFNHAILCVPEKNDTIWLECTDQTSPFNYLGSFTCDRDVLAVTSEGGKILHTPSYGRDFNIVNTYSDIKVYSTGNADVNVRFEQWGLRYDDLFAISESKPDVRKLWLANQFGSAAFDIKKEEFLLKKNSAIPSATAVFDIHLRDLAAKSSKLLFLSPSFISGVSYIWDDPCEIELDMDYQQNDTAKIEIPIGYDIEFLPEDKNITTKFGHYSSQIKTEDKYIYYTRKLTFNKATYPHEAYREFYNFITDIATAERQMLVLKSVY